MLGQFLIMLREGFEAAFITSILISYLKATGREGSTRYVWYGVWAAIGFSLIVGSSVWLTYGTLTEQNQKLFESAASALAVIVLTYMIHWMAGRGREVKTEIRRKVEEYTDRKTVLGLTSMSFIIVSREGVETILFLSPFLVNETLATLTGILLGTAASLTLAYIIFIACLRVDIRRFFYITSILLVLLAGGLAGYATHELIEYSETVDADLGWIAEHAYDLKIPEDNILHHKGVVGSILAVMFGYTEEAEWARIIIQISYTAITLPAIIKVYKRSKHQEART